jgi:arylesterase/paraoxonase
MISMFPLTSLQRWLILGAVLALTLLSIITWRYYAAAGAFTAIKSEIAAACHVLSAPPGPDDIEIDRARGQAFAAAQDRRALNAGANAARGGVYLIDLTQPVDQWRVRPVTAMEPADFHPQGLSLYLGPDGKRRLFVVNRRSSGKSTVEIFDVAADGGLTLARSVESDFLIAPNDVVAVGPDSFYVTNTHDTASGTWAWIDDMLLARTGNVVYFDGKAARQVADRLAYANGINKSADGKTIYVTESLGLALHLYTRDPMTGTLTPTDYSRMGSSLDNIDVEPDGALLIASHPKLTSLHSHMKDASELSPSQVIRVELLPGGGRAGTIYLNLGHEISGATVAAGYKDWMLLGNAYDPNILVCKQSKEIRGY